MTIVIIEGPDLAGKTYFIEKFSKHMNNGIIIKNNYKPKTGDDFNKIREQYVVIFGISKAYNEYLGNKKGLVILDRFYPSQSVYSYLRNKDELNSEVEKEFEEIAEELAEEFNTKMIFLNTPLKVLEKRYDERGDEHIKKEMLAKLYDRYQTFMKNTKLEVLYLDTSKEGWLKKAEKFVK